MQSQLGYARYLEAQAKARPVVARMLRRYPDDVDDVLQDAVVKAIRFDGQFRGASQWQTWFTAIAIKQALMRLRRYRGSPSREVSCDRKGRSLALQVVDSEPGPLEWAASEQRRARLHEAIARLRSPILRHAAYETLAGVGIEENNNRKARRFRMREKLREALTGLI